MTLQEKLNERKRSFLASGRATPEMIGIMQRSTQELRASGILQRVLAAGEKAPSFDLPNQDGKRVTSSSLLAAGPLVVSFFRGAW